MTLLEKINNLTWFNEINKLKEILLGLFQSISSTQIDIEDLQNNPVDSRPYKVYTALLNQSGTNNPTATVLENTLGVVSISRQDEGIYIITSTGNLTFNKRFIFKGILKSSDGVNGYIVEGDEIVGSNNQIQLFCKDINNQLVDELVNFPIEIRVYN